MSRSISAQMQAVSVAKVVRPFYLVDLEFSSPIRMWTGLGELDAPSGLELVTNGTFTGSLAGWTTVTFGTGQVNYNNNTAELSGSSFQNRAAIRQSIQTISGKKYKINFENSLSARVIVFDVVNTTNIVSTLFSSGSNSLEFTASSNTSRIEIRHQSGGTCVVDNVSMFQTEVYQGLGDLLSIGQIKESTDLQANGTNISLSGIKQSIITVARDEDYQGKKGTIRLGAMNEQAEVITNPVNIFSGFMDVMTITDSGVKSTINVTLENKLIAFERKYVRRYTDNDQKIEYPTDDGFEYVASIQDTEIVWGKPTPETAGTRVTTEPVVTNR